MRCGGVSTAFGWAPHFAQHDRVLGKYFSGCRTTSAGRRGLCSAFESAGGYQVQPTGGDARRSISFVPVPHRLAFVVAQHERVGTLHHLTGEDEVGTVLFDF